MGDDRPEPGAQARARLERWARLYALGDEEALSYRLAWEGLDRARALAVLSEAAAAAAVGDEAPCWTGWVVRFLEEARGLAEDLRRGEPVPEARDFAPDEEPPFVELAVPVVRAARHALSERLGRPAELGDSLLGACERQLCKEAAGHAELAWYGTFEGGAGVEGTGSRGSPGPRAAEAIADRRYREFVAAMLEHGFEAHLDAYPVLARTLARLAETWVEATAELVERWERDREAIVATVFEGDDPGVPADVEPGLSDRHDGGRRVATLIFESGRRLVYKPRDVGIEGALSELLAWAADAGLESCPPALRVLERDGYGWVEHATAADLDAGRSGVVEEFFRRAGALLCLAWVLRGRDLHAENLVATARGPVLVDAEMLLQPVLLDEAADGPAAGVGETCLGTGMATLLQTGSDGTVRDIGGLCGRRARGGSVPVRHWEGLRSDGIAYVREAGQGPEVHNRLRVAGVPQRARAFADQIVEGFEKAYRFLVERRDVLLASGGPLEAFRGRPVRFLLRTSDQYGALLHVLAAPRHQRHGVDRSLGIDSINRVWAGRRERPVLWPLVIDERRALEALDVPRFTVPSDGRTPISGRGAEVDEVVEITGIDAVVERLDGLSEEDLHRQVELLRWSLAASADERLVPEPPAVSAVASVSAEERASDAGTVPVRDAAGELLLAAAVWIGEVLQARAERTSKGGLEWKVPALLRGGDGRLPRVDLYEGVAGPALLFAALARTTGEDRWAAACRACLLPRAAELEEIVAVEPGLGVADGVCSVFYAATLAGRLTGDPDLGSLGPRLAGRVTAERIDAADHPDVVAGLAGAVLGLLALHDAPGPTGRERWLELAARAGDRLLEAGVAAGDGTAWPGVGGELRTGFAHGAAGIACALGRLFARTDDERYAAAAAAAFRFEEELYSTRAGNWRISAEGRQRPGAGSGWMVAWCHGAPGGALARALVLGTLPEGERPARDREIEAAMETTAGSGEDGDDHLCCGRLGRSDALLTVGRRRGDERLTAAAAEIAVGVAERALDRGRFAVPSTPFARQVFLPGFFRGLSGIGYQLVRVARPGRIPSVLAFELDGEIGQAAGEIGQAAGEIGPEAGEIGPETGEGAR